MKLRQKKSWNEQSDVKHEHARGWKDLQPCGVPNSRRNVVGVMGHIKGPFLKNFIERTIKNLNFITETARKEKEGSETPTVYEVTQLINSMLGIFVLTHENHDNQIPDISKKKLIDDNFPTNLFSTKIGPDISNLKQLIENIRHSTAHFNFKTVADPNETSEIGSITLKNKLQGDNSRIAWEVQLTVDELHRVVQKVAVLLTRSVSDSAEDKWLK